MLSRSIVISHRRHRARWTSTASPCSRFFSADSTIKSSSDDGSFKQGLSRLFTDEQRELLKQAHKLSSMSRSLAKQVGNVKIREESLLVDIAKCLQEGREEKLETSEDVIPSLFTVVFAGEFNSGKSTLINALCGNKELLESGVLPTTDKITVLMASEGDSNSNNERTKTIQVDTGVVAQTELRLLPTSSYPILKDLCIIDTPGTNAILSLQHTSSTLRLLHDADLIVFVTSADRPFSESERQLLQTSIKPYRKRVVLVINKIDILERRQGDDHGQETKQKMVDYVQEHASDLLGASPIVIPVSGRDALSWKQLQPGFVGSENESSNNSNLWTRSNFGQLETFLSATLTASSKIKTKLSNPLGVAEGILLDCKHEIERRQEDLDVDVATLKLLRSDSEAFEKDMTSILDRHRLNINKEWTTRAQVVQRVLDELTLVDQLRIGIGMGRNTFDRAWENANMTSVLSTAKESSSFSNKLISITSECSEALVSGAKKQGEDQIEYLGKRVSVISTGLKGNNSKMIGKIDTPKFQRLEDELQATIVPVIEKTTKHLPSDLECADNVYTSFCRASMLSSLLMSSGMCSTALTFGGFLDMSQGMLLCSATLTVAGVTSLPLGSRYIARSFEKEWMSNASKLENGLDALFSNAMQRINGHLSDAINPYTRYVKSEETSLISLHKEMESGIADANRLRGHINKACE